MMPQTPERLASIARLEARADELRAEIYADLKPWQRVQVARHPNRPCMLDYVERLFTEFTELHGDRRFADDKAIVTGLGFFHGEPVAVVGHQKGRDTKQKIYRNFGYAKPEGYRKALRVMRLAEKFKRPVIVFVDTPAAYPGIESEERGVAEAIALNLREMALLDVPIVVIVCGEGGSGGALGIAVGDRVLMQEFGVYSVIPPEGCAAILWRDAQRKVEAAEALKITAPDLLALGLIDEIVKEPIGGAHLDYDAGGRPRRRSDRAASAGAAGDVAGRAARGALPEVPRDGPAGQAFVDDGSRRRRRPRARPTDAAPRLGRRARATTRASRATAAAVGVPPVIARLLCQRGLDDPDGGAPLPRARARRSSTIRSCSPACARPSIGSSPPSRAASAIAIHGDYDVDGITATVILRRAIELLGGDVAHFVPDRFHDGYGLQPATVERLPPPARA